MTPFFAFSEYPAAVARRETAQRCPAVTEGRVPMPAPVSGLRRSGMPAPRAQPRRRKLRREMSDGLTRSPTYVRVYTGPDGETHFEDVYLPAVPHASSTGTEEARTAPLAAREIVFRTVLTEASDTTPHTAPERLLIIQVDATVEVRVSDGEVRDFGPGQVLVLEDTTGKGHVTRCVSGGPRTTLIAPLG